MNDKNKAIGLVWYVPKSKRKQFQKEIESETMPKLISLHGSKKITAVLPFHHKPLRAKGGGSFWTDYWVIVLALNAKPEEIWQSIKNSMVESGLLRAEILRTQPGMDMYYPRIGGANNEPVWHVVEYVVSKPETRAQYYKDQYKFSQPVIRHFWENNVVERMIGFESVRLLEDKSILPKWDVIHITGFKPFFLGKIAWHLLRFLPVFNSYARKIGYKSAMEVLRSWDKKRIKYMTIAKQDQANTLQSLEN